MVPSSDTQRIQEVHTVVVHVLTELVEEALFGRSSAVARGVPPEVRRAEEWVTPASLSGSGSELR